MTDLTDIVLAILGVISAIISTYLIPYIRQRYSKDQIDKACKLAQVAVNAAEQLAKTGVIEKRFRKSFAMEMLDKAGIKLDTDMLSDIVEAYVLELPHSVTPEESKEK